MSYLSIKPMTMELNLIEHMMTSWPAYTQDTGVKYMYTSIHKIPSNQWQLIKLV